MRFGSTIPLIPTRPAEGVLETEEVKEEGVEAGVGEVEEGTAVANAAMLEELRREADDARNVKASLTPERLANAEASISGGRVARKLSSWPAKNSFRSSGCNVINTDEESISEERERVLALLCPRLRCSCSTSALISAGSADRNSGSKVSSGVCCFGWSFCCKLPLLAPET